MFISSSFVNDLYSIIDLKNYIITLGARRINYVSRRKLKRVSAFGVTGAEY